MARAPKMRRPALLDALLAQHSHDVNNTTQITCSRCLMRGGRVTVTDEPTPSGTRFQVKCERYGHVTNGVPLFGCCGELTAGALTYGDVERK